MHITYQKSLISFENSVDRDQLASSKPADQDPHCFPSTQKLEELKALKRSPDLLNNVKIGLGQLSLIL